MVIMGKLSLCGKSKDISKLLLFDISAQEIKHNIVQRFSIRNRLAISATISLSARQPYNMEWLFQPTIFLIPDADEDPLHCFPDVRAKLYINSSL